LDKYNQNKIKIKNDLTDFSQLKKLKHLRENIEKYRKINNAEV